MIEAAKKPVYFEIINMSDPYTICGDDLLVACLAVTLLGEGRYALRDADDEEIMPLMMFGDGEKWFQKRFEKPLEELLEEISLERLAAALESVAIGTFDDRADYDKALSLIGDPEKKKQFIQYHHERRLSSLNDIGGRAYKMAALLQKRIATKATTV